jgi:hypothetical protein
LPELSRFFGIIIAMYYNDHAPPHFHARYGDDEASIRIDNGEVMEGASAPALDGSSMSGASCTKQSCLKTGPEPKLVSP